MLYLAMYFGLKYSSILHFFKFKIKSTFFWACLWNIKHLFTLYLLKFFVKIHIHSTMFLKNEPWRFIRVYDNRGVYILSIKNCDIYLPAYCTLKHKRFSYILSSNHAITCIVGLRGGLSEMKQDRISVCNDLKKRDKTLKLRHLNWYNQVILFGHFYCFKNLKKIYATSRIV